MSGPKLKPGQRLSGYRMAVREDGSWVRWWWGPTDSKPEDGRLVASFERELLNTSPEMREGVMLICQVAAAELLHQATGGRASEMLYLDPETKEPRP